MVKYLREREEKEFERYHALAEKIDKRDRVILKNEEERAVFEEVFDRRTLMTLYSMANKGSFSFLNGVISSGKEARVYWGVTNEKKDVAVKIYLVASSDFKKRAQYVIGDPRFTRFRRDSQSVAELWARKEFTNLQQAFDCGLSVPEPISFERNVLMMEFIGELGVPSPTIRHAEVTKKDYQKLLKEISLLYSEAKLVHADLSEYNVFKLHERLIIFDFGSAVSIEHPLSYEFLKRDLENVNTFFARKGIHTTASEDLLHRITKI